MNDKLYNFARNAVIIVVMIAVIFTIIAVLAIPIILSVAYSWYYMLIYTAYLAAAIYIVAEANKRGKENERS